MICQAEDEIENKASQTSDIFHKSGVRMMLLSKVLDMFARSARGYPMNIDHTK
jgi:hypothetical protein